MAAPHDKTRLFYADGQALEETGVEIFGDATNHEIETGREQVTRESEAGIDGDVEFDGWRERAQLEQCGGDDIEGGACDGAERDSSASAGSEIGEFLFRMGDLKQDGARLTRQRLAERGQTNAARKALAELGLEQRLHLADHA